MDEGQSDESQNRPEKKPHAEPNDEDPDVKRLKVEDHAETTCDEDEDFVNVEEKPWRTFFVVSAGKTNGAHRDFVKKLEAVGHTEASSPEGCDYVVCFCPRLDMDEALKKMPADKPFILVVMHFNPDHVVVENSRLVNNPDVLLTVDCLFCEGQFLKCERNNEAWDEVKKKLGVYDYQKKDIFKASQTLFYIFLAGKTNDAHRDFVKKLEAVGQTEASSPEGCDYVVCFCPVASRVGTDVNAALNRIPADKPSILVVMHHTFNPDHVVAESRRLVIKSNVHLTLDCLYYEGHFLKCKRNDEAWDEVKKKLGVSDNQERSSSSSLFNWWPWNKSDQLVGNKEPPVCVKNDAGDKNCAIRPSVGKDCSEAQNKMPVAGQTFVVVLAGETNGVHRDFVKKLEAVGQTEATSPEGCDYVVCFCPVASQVAIDVNEALDRIPADKPSILVVMHHTYSPDHVVAESRRLVTKSNVHLTLDCLYYEGHFLKCKRNDEAWDEVKKKLGVSDNQERSSSSSLFNWWPWNKSDQLVGNKEPPVCVKNDAGDKNCAIRPSVGKDCSEAQNKMSVTGQTFVVVLAGETNGAHRDFVKKLEAVGQTEAASPEGCDYVVCFCPVASQVAIDVNEALDRIPADKPCILVVMHHTYSPDHVVAESRRLVNNSHVLLTVDCLFYEGQFLKCERNNAAWDEVKKKVIQNL